MEAYHRLIKPLKKTHLLLFLMSSLIILFWVFALLFDHIFSGDGPFLFYEAIRLKGYTLPARPAVALVQLPFTILYNFMNGDIISLKNLYSFCYFSFQFIIFGLLVTKYRKSPKLPLAILAFAIVITSMRPTSERSIIYLLLIFGALGPIHLIRIFIKILILFLHPFCLFFYALELLLYLKKEIKFTKYEKLLTLFLSLIAFLYHFVFAEDYNRFDYTLTHISKYAEYIPFYITSGILLFLPKKQFDKYFPILILPLFFIAYLFAFIKYQGIYPHYVFALKYTVLMTILCFYRNLLSQEISQRAELSKVTPLFLTLILVTLSTMSLYNNQKRIQKIHSLLVSSKTGCVRESELKSSLGESFLLEKKFEILRLYFQENKIRGFINFPEYKKSCAEILNESKVTFHQLFPDDFTLFPNPLLRFDRE